MTAPKKGHGTGLTSLPLGSLTPSMDAAMVEAHRQEDLNARSEAILKDGSVREQLTDFGIYVGGMSQKSASSITATRVGGYLNFTYTDRLDAWITPLFPLFDKFKNTVGEQDNKDPRKMCSRTHAPDKGCKHFSEGPGKSFNWRQIAKALHDTLRTDSKTPKNMLLTKANLLSGTTIDTLDQVPPETKDYSDYSFLALVLARLAYQLKHSPGGDAVFPGALIVDNNQMPSVKVFEGELDMEDISRANLAYVYWRNSARKKKEIRERKENEEKNKKEEDKTGYTYRPLVLMGKITELPFGWTAKRVKQAKQHEDEKNDGAPAASRKRARTE